MKEHIIRAILYQDMSVKWKDAELNGDVNVHLNVHQKTRQFVEAELGDFILNADEAVLASFEKTIDGEINHVNPEKMDSTDEERRVFRLQIPTLVHNTPGEWGVQFFVVTDYDPITGNYTDAYPFDKAKFSEHSSFIDDGLTVPTGENLRALYDAIPNKVSEAYANEAEAVIASIEDLYERVDTNSEYYDALKLRVDNNENQVAQIEDIAAQVENNRLMAVQNDEDIEDLIDKVGTLNETAENANTVAKETKDMFWSISDKVDDLESYKITESQAREIALAEIAKFDFIKIVAELPEEGLPNRFYLVPKTDGSSTDLFDAWTWVNKGTEEEPAYGWEYEGTKSAEFDPTLFVKFSDYAGYNNQLGVVSLNATFGITSYNNSLYKNALSIQPATEEHINTHKNGISADLYHPIVPARLQYAIKKGLTENELALTDEDQTNACDWLGAVKKLGGGNGWRVYAVFADGTETSFPVVNAVTEATIPWRGTGGVVKVGTPVADEDATPRSFVGNLPDYLTMTDDERAKWLSMLGATKLYKQTISISPSGNWENYDRLIVISSKKEAITDSYELIPEIMNHSGYIAYDDDSERHKIVAVFDGFECVVCDRSDNGFTLTSLDFSTILGHAWSSDIVSVEEI